MIDVVIDKFTINEKSIMKTKNKNIFDFCKTEDTIQYQIYVSQMHSIQLIGSIDISKTQNLNIKFIIDYFEEIKQINIQFTHNNQEEKIQNAIHASTVLYLEKIEEISDKTSLNTELKIVKNKLVIGNLNVVYRKSLNKSILTKKDRINKISEASLNLSKMDTLRIGWDRVMIGQKLQNLSKMHFQNFFQIDQDSIQLFKDYNSETELQSSAKFKAHGIKFTSTLDSAIKSIHNHENLEQIFGNLAKVHHMHKVTLEHYKSMGLAFQMTLQGCFGENQTIKQADCFSTLQNLAVNILIQNGNTNETVISENNSKQEVNNSI